MHISFTAHQASGSTSCSNLIEYLEKENQLQESNEKFFNSEFQCTDASSGIDGTKVLRDIDTNRGSQNFESSNFYMLNISPSAKELTHMESLAVDTLTKRGFDEDSNRENVYYIEQKDELMKIQMKLYTQDLMNEYATNFGREIYCNEEKLPNAVEKKELNLETDQIFADYLKEKGIEVDSKEETKSKQWIEVNNIQIIEQKGKSALIQLDLEEGGKATVFVPKTALQLQENGNYKLPENVYHAKVNEVIDKNTLSTINADFKSVSELKNKEKVFNFSIQDQRFKEPLTYSINQKDLTIKKGEYFTSEHLLKEKTNKAIQKAIDKEFGKDKERIYQELAHKKGFDLSTRPLTGDDLLWYGKIESSRTYKANDKFAVQNKNTLDLINKLEQTKGDKKEIKTLKENLHRDKETGKIIEGGDKKGGMQIHAHVVVSRHDKTMKNPRNKLSLSPLANAKESRTQHGEKIGFDRTVFFQKGEKVFDTKFEYDRPKEQTFNHYNQEKKELKGLKNEITGQVKGKATQFLLEHSGLSEIKQQISPVASIKKELGIVANIPTNLPKGVIDFAFKTVRAMGQDMGY
ncbi:DUF5712 family protein [Flavobacterium crassostreae]|uniref:Mobilization protein n=1 Tax=Flavobacterium crassostreae TaxID=1763534 RepID=A0A1B9EA67_9FLAO|nr:DUF5712 family protein [Flavobacterium crassostreae]OCB78846.1 hypothetical protein LPBF_00225 [Flavobacterium crassostreae]